MIRNTFAELFRSTVAPRLREMCRIEGVQVACGLQSITAAHAKVMREAIRLGATHLSDALFRDLDDYLAAWILEYANAVQPQIDAANRVTAEYAKHERRWLQ